MKKMLYLNIVLILFLLLNLNLCSETFHKVRLLKISDGDTFVVQDNSKRIKLRLLYIDTPEKFSSRKLSKESIKCRVSKKKIIKLGKLSTKYAKKYFKRQKYILVYYKGKGHYKRTLAVVKRFDKNTTYNFDVVKDGYSCIYRWAYYPGEYLQAYNKAKNNEKGLWNLDYSLMECICEK